MKKIKIKQENKQTDEIIGISSTHADFRIAWSLNNLLQIHLSKSKDVSVLIKRNDSSETLSFSLFTFDDSDENGYYLLSNKDKGKNMSSKYKNIDYFFIVKSNVFILQNLSNKLNNTEYIDGTFILQTDMVLKKMINKLFEH